MKFSRIFVETGDCRLWSTTFPPSPNQKPVDLFRQLFNQWNDTAYLQQFFLANQALLADPFWRGITVDEAIDQVLDEAYDFELELQNIESGHPSYAGQSLSNIFEYFDEGSYIFQGNNLHHKKARPNSRDPMIRIYAAEFDGAYIVTGGLLKLTEQLERAVATAEKAKINSVLQYLNDEGVYTRQGLDEL